MKKKLIGAVVFGALLTSATWAQQTLLANESEIKFTAKQLGVNVSGQFTKFEADVNFHPENLEQSQATVTVETASATMKNAEADKNLKQATWFNAADFPKATFKTESIKSLGQNKYEALGTLTIKDVSKEVSVPLTVTQTGNVTTVAGSLPIERLTYKVGEKEWSDTSVVANQVKVDFKLAIDGIAAIK